MYCSSYVHSPMYKPEPNAAGATGPAAGARAGARRAAEAVDLEDSDMEALLGLSQAGASAASELPREGCGAPPASTEPGPYLVTAVVPFGACDEAGDVGHPVGVALDG